MAIFELDKETAASWLPGRIQDSHKGTYGTVMIAAGCPGMMGAAIFAAGAAYRTGVGLVKAVIPKEGALVMTIRVPEAVQIMHEFNENAVLPDSVSSIVLGPGLGDQPVFFRQVMEALPEEIPMVVDADGLNLLAKHPIRRKNMILTPHFGEAQRLSGRPIPELKADPIETARQLSEKYQAVVLLKGVPTVIVSPDGRIALNRTGNPGMSTAGSGDVLAGTIGGLLAQMKEPDLFKATVLGAWLHGSAGDCAAREVGQFALMASDILNHLRPDFLIQ